jgi:hypothetical protein
MAAETFQTLAELLASAPIPYELFLELAEKLAMQIQSLHSQQLAHGQIVPWMIDIGPTNQLVLRSPEKFVEATDETIRQDLYQAGLVFAEMLSGRTVKGDETPIHPIVSEHLPLDLASNLVPVESRLLMDDLLAEDPRQRIKTSGELVSTIRELRRLHQIPLEPSKSGGGQDRSRLYFIVAMIALLLLAVWVLLGIVYRGD